MDLCPTGVMGDTLHMRKGDGAAWSLTDVGTGGGGEGPTCAVLQSSDADGPQLSCVPLAASPHIKTVPWPTKTLLLSSFMAMM